MFLIKVILTVNNNTANKHLEKQSLSLIEQTAKGLGTPKTIHISYNRDEANRIISFTSTLNLITEVDFTQPLSIMSRQGKVILIRGEDVISAAYNDVVKELNSKDLIPCKLVSIAFEAKPTAENVAGLKINANQAMKKDLGNLQEITLDYTSPAPRRNSTHWMNSQQTPLLSNNNNTCQDYGTTDTTDSSQSTYKP